MTNYIFLKARQAGRNSDNRSRLFELMPRLAEVYLIDPTAHVMIDMLTINPSEEAIYNLIEQIVMQNIDLNKMLIKAIEQGFNPQQK